MSLEVKEVKKEEIKESNQEEFDFRIFNNKFTINDIKEILRFIFLGLEKCEEDKKPCHNGFVLYDILNGDLNFQIEKNPKKKFFDFSDFVGLGCYFDLKDILYYLLLGFNYSEVYELYTPINISSSLIKFYEVIYNHK